MTVGAKSAVEAATFDALTAGVTLAPVYQHAPEDYPLPVVVIGDIDADAEAFGAKGDDQDQKIALTIVSLIKAAERAPVFAIEQEVQTALSNLNITQTGWLLSFIYTGCEGAVSEGDGEALTYVSNSHFTVFALRDN